MLSLPLLFRAANVCGYISEALGHERSFLLETEETVFARATAGTACILWAPSVTTAMLTARSSLPTRPATHTLDGKAEKTRQRPAVLK